MGLATGFHRTIRKMLDGKLRDDDDYDGKCYYYLFSVGGDRTEDEIENWLVSIHHLVIGNDSLRWVGLLHQGMAVAADGCVPALHTLPPSTLVSIAAFVRVALFTSH